MFESFFLADALGYAATLLFTAAFVFYNPRASMATMVSGSALFTGQCLLLGLTSAAIASVLSIVLTLAALRVKDNRLSMIIGLYIIALLLSAVWTVQEPLAILPLVGNAISAIARYGRDRFWFFRSYITIGNLIWVFFGLQVGSIPIVISTGLIVIINLITMAFYSDLIPKPRRRRLQPATAEASHAA
jgi:Bacterial inner membrane protein.